MKALWFSRHPMTQTQMEEVYGMGYEIVCLEEGLELGSKNLMDDDDVNAVLSALLNLIVKHRINAVFGVFTAPVQEYMFGSSHNTADSIPCYAAWNVQRPVDGGKPMFEHKRFCQVGLL